MTLDLNQLACRRAEDLSALLRTQANALVIGHHETLAAFVTICRSELQQPIVCTSAARLISLPLSGTLVIEDLEQLSRASQRALTAWLNAREHDHTRVISLTVRPLFPLVEADQFDPSLFYRLNTISLDLRFW